jgi:hypothetical protein
MRRKIEKQLNRETDRKGRDKADLFSFSTLFEKMSEPKFLRIESKATRKTIKKS